MQNAGYFKNKKVIIVGLARSGSACANLLHGLGAEVSVSDNSQNEAVRQKAEDLQRKGISVELGRHSSGFVSGRDLMVISPGVPESALPLVWAKEAGMPILSEIEVAWRLCPAQVIATTGTNGKTTVTTLIGKILEASGKKVFVCGNIGNPFCAEVARMQPEDFVSLEVSSFQLEHVQTFKPKIALILNLSLNHLDRYKDMQDYLGAKKRIFMNQDFTDYLVLNDNDPMIRELGRETQAKVIYFGQEEGLNPNQAAVLTAASLLGIDHQLALRVFNEFKGVEHRLENVAEINQVIFINDSKATTVEATVWALRNISRPVILICGGREKGNDYCPILDLACKRVKAMVAIGEAKDKIMVAFGGHLSVSQAGSLEEAVSQALAKAVSGDCVLLSPMCKSFDMFFDYEERGRVFKKAVYAINKEKSLYGA